MRKAQCRTVNSIVYQRLAEIWLSERERRRTKHELRDAEAIADAVIWVKERVPSLGARLLKPGFKH
jgi:hypothetical protein